MESRNVQDLPRESITSRQFALGLATLLLFGFVILLFARPAEASATNVYLAQTAVGAANGADCADAYAYTFFNASGNWGSGSSQIGPGTTVHLCGTFTGTAGQTLLTFQGSGSSGSPITLKFEAGAVLQAPYWASGGAIATGSTAWVVIDGGTNGIIKNTRNGTSGGTCSGGACSYQQDSRFIYVGGCSSCNITVENLTCADVYIHTPNSNDTYSNDGAECVYFSSSNHANMTVKNSVCYNATDCVDGWGDNETVSGNEFYECNRCIVFGTNAPTSGLYIYGNYIHDPQIWDESSTDAWHHDDIHLFPNSGSADASGVEIYNNWFAGGGACCNTAHVYFEGVFTSPEIFNNFFDNTTASPYNHRPGLYMGSGSGSQVITNALVVDNVVLGGDESFSGNVDYFFGGQMSNITFENNIATGGNTLVSLQSGGSFASGKLDDNLYETLTNTSNMFGYGGSTYSSFSGWQTATGQDGSSKTGVFSSLGVNSTGMLQSGSPAVLLGANLTSLGITALDKGAPQTFGPTGTCGTGCVARPSSASGPCPGSTGCWSAGAYGPNGSNGPAAPTGLVAIVH